MTRDDLEIIDVAADPERRVPDRSSKRFRWIVGASLMALVVVGVVIGWDSSAHEPDYTRPTPTTIVGQAAPTAPPAPVRIGATTVSPLSLRAVIGRKFGSVLAVDGSLWIQTLRVRCARSCSEAWWRADPRSGAIRRTPMPASVDNTRFYPGLSSIWTLHYRLDDTPFTLSRIDPSTGRVTAHTLLAGTGRVGNTNPPDDVVESGDSVWVYASGTLIRLDPAALHETARVTVPPLGGLVVDHSVVWAIDYGNGGLWRIDPRTNAATRVVNACCFAQSIAADGRYLWFTHATSDGGQDLVRVTEASPYEVVSARIPTAQVVASPGVVRFLGTDTGLAATSDPGFVGFVEPGTHAITRVEHAPVTREPYVDATIVLAGGTVWVDDASSTLTRVG